MARIIDTYACFNIIKLLECVYTKHPGHILNSYNLYVVHKYFEQMIMLCSSTYTIKYIYPPRGSRVPWNRGHRCGGWCLHLAFGTTRPPRIIPSNNRSYYNTDSRIRSKKRRDGCPLSQRGSLRLKRSAERVYCSRVGKEEYIYIYIYIWRRGNKEV